MLSAVCNTCTYLSGWHISLTGCRALGVLSQCSSSSCSSYCCDCELLFAATATESAAGSSLHAQPVQAFDFRALAQAAGQSQPQMPPMPKGVTTLEDLERHARASGPTPPPGVARPGFSVGPHAPVPADSQNDEEHAAIAPTAAAAMSPAQPAQATTAASSPWAGSGAQTAQDAASQDSGKTLLSLLSRAAPAGVPAEQPGRTAITPPPGFPAISKPQAPISWGTSPQLQGIWGAPSPATGGAQATWGAASNAPRSDTPTTQQAAFAQLLQAGAAERPEARPSQQSQAVSNAFVQAARVPSGEVPNQPGSAKHEHAGAASLGVDRMASSGAVQADADVRSNQAASAAANPLLALLGQHRSSTSSGGHTFGGSMILCILSNTMDTKTCSAIAMLLPVRLVAIAICCCIVVWIQVIWHLLPWPCIIELAR